MIRSFAPAVLYFIISVVLLTLPGSTFPSESWMDGIHFDKFIHVGMFAGLTFLVCWGMYCRIADPLKATGETVSAAVKARLWRSFIYIAIASLVYGIIMEYVQRDFIPNRSFDSGDILADGAGSLAGLLVSRFRYIKK
ncbi:MAG: VanZ family protein [Chitinophagaceae bacterium]|nr:MAG: VanZ family protein [Chitinophagaceae bacterium]